MDWDKDREESQIDFCHGQNHLTWGNWFGLLPIKSKLDNEK